MFATEHEMSLRFEKFFQAQFGNAYIKECKGLSAIPDFICYDKNEQEISIISFELKLINWRKAAKQAFRHKGFADAVYVVLDPQQASKALDHVAIFQQYNIGLATFDIDGNFDIKYKPQRTIPFSDNLTKKIRSVVTPFRKKLKNAEMLVA